MRKRSSASRQRQTQNGYTLLDVTIIIAIIGVLATIGLNTYEKQVARAKRPESIMAFRALAAQQREYLLTHGKYAGTFTDLGFNIEGGAVVSPTEIQGRRYNYRIVQDDGPRSWYVVATGNIDGDPFPDIIAASNPR
jgi:Tfp pilus assembly protein PilE